MHLRPFDTSNKQDVSDLHVKQKGVERKQEENTSMHKS